MTTASPSGTPSLWRWALLLALVGQLYVLYDPTPGGPTLFAGADKIVHAVVFGLPVALAGLGVRRWPWLAVALAVHAPVSELIQGHCLQARSADPWDVVADLGGVAVGALLAVRAGRPRGRGVRASW